MDVAEGHSICPSCEQPIPADRIAVHLAGLDAARLECPRQDLLAIVAEAREEEQRQRAARWLHRGVW